ncbi:MAG: hypothetical protein NTV34_05685 [Proteobacteria bacterium]|nr:hypothetical protein [Pseudomonadota bacterium]
MNKIAFILAMTGLAACGKSNNSASFRDVSSATPQSIFTCTLSKPELDGYYATIILSEAKLNIKQSSRSARFAMIEHGVEKDDTLGIPNAKATFTCSISKPEQDSYHATISVYEDRVILLQSSRSARFAPLKYKIIEPAIAVAPVRTFSRDSRPVDGDLKELKLVKVGSKYDVTLRTALWDRVHGQAVDTTEKLGSGLECIFATDAISCERDDRPVDGMLTEVTLVNDRNQWSALLRTAFYDRSHGQAVDETKLLSSGLLEQN